MSEVANIMHYVLCKFDAKTWAGFFYIISDSQYGIISRCAADSQDINYTLIEIIYRTPLLSKSFHIMEHNYSII